MAQTTDSKPYKNLQVVYHLWLALATLLVLSLTTSLLLLLLEPLLTPANSVDNAYPSGIALILAIGGSMLFTYSLLILLTKDYFKQVFQSQLNTNAFWLLISLVTGFAIAFLINKLSLLSPPVAGEANTFDIIQNHSFTAQLLLLAVTVILAPVFEEYLFRGLVLDALLVRFDTFVAICLSAVVFMGFHLIEYYNYWVGLAAILILGFLLAIIRKHSGSILNPIICHATYNLSILLLV